MESSNELNIILFKIWTFLPIRMEEVRTGALASLGVEDGAVDDPGVNSLERKKNL